MRILLLIVLSFFSMQALYSQELKPKAVATPEAAMMDKFGNIPVSYYTGVPEISIPIYTIRAGSYEVPIVLRYHSSGVQVEENATWVGLGWDLTVEGGVRQNIYGMLDQDNNYPSMNATTYNNMIAHAQINDQYSGMENAITSEEVCTQDGCPGQTYDLSSIVSMKTYDWGQPNTYTVSLPSGSAQFYLDPMTHTPNQYGNKSESYIIQKATNTSTYVSEWTIKDAHGNVYFFSRDHNEFSYNTASTQYYNSLNAKLSQITVPGGQTITYNYTDGKYQIPSYSQNKVHNSHEGSFQSYSTINTIEYLTKYLTSIETETEKVEFVLSSTAGDRQDMVGINMQNGYGAKRLSAIHIWDKINNRKVKSILFTYDYFYSDPAYSGITGSSSNYLSKRLKLVSVTIVGYTPEGNQVFDMPPYIFEYDETHALPNKDAYARDHWGYFNGQSQNTSFIPDLENDILSGNFVYTDFALQRMPDFVLNDFKNDGQANKGMKFEFATAGILKKITYPTGGYSKLEYEPNRFKNYRVFSADEINSGEGHVTTSLTDFNTSLSVPLGPLLVPDGSGRLTIYDFTASFTRVDQTINYSYFLGAWVKLWKVDAANIRTEIRSWHVTNDQNAFNQANGSTTPPEYIDLLGLTTDRYQFEVYMPDIPELTPQGGSLIPVAIVSCLYTIKDPQSLQEESIGGGLRIASLENYDYFNHMVNKTSYSYKQSDGVTTSGKLMSPIRNHSYVEYRIGYPSPIFDYWYQVASFGYVPTAYDAQGALVGYDRAEVTEVDALNNKNGKTVYNYRNNASVVFSYELGIFNKSVPNSPYLDNGLITSVEYHSNNDLIKKIEYGYISIERTIKRAAVLFDLMYGVASVTGCWDADYAPCGADWHVILPHGKWLGAFYPLTTQRFVPSYIKEYNYTAGGVLITRKDFQEYNAIGQVTKEESTNSQGITETALHTYPYDVPSPPSIVQEMLSKRLYHLIQQDVKKVSGVEKSKTTYTYQTNANGNINLGRIQNSINVGAFYDVVTSGLYDAKDNLVQIDKNGAVQSYLYDYNLTLRIAEVENATLGNVAFTSFEANGTGGWAGINSNLISSTGDVPTGKRYLNGSFSITKSGLPATTFFVSYWSKNGAFDVNGSTGISGKTIGGWTYFEHKVINPTGGLITVFGNGAIDELRLYPQKSFITTYTYDPVIGVTSKCDPNNRITYFEYDGFGRLLRIRDEDKNIIKQFNYFYQLNTSTSPNWQFTGQTRCKPCPANNNYISNILQNEERDLNPESPTYNQTRWTDVGTSGSCVPQPDWQNTSTPLRCQVNGSNQNTGYQEQEQIDMNPCSSTYNQIRWIVVGYNPTVCPPPSGGCNSSNCNGVDRKCINGVCEIGVRKNISTVRLKCLINGVWLWKWNCTWHYCFSDGSSSINFVEECNDNPCTIDGSLCGGPD